MAEQSRLQTIRQRMRDDLTAARGWFVHNWREHRWFRWGSALLALGVIVLALGWTLLARGLPDAESLLDYETPLPTVVRGVDGEIVHSYARERRVQLQYVDFPTTLVEAFLAAEDKTFFSHGGVDLAGTANAVFDYASKMGSGERAVGGSTITQQVAKNVLLGDEYSVTRKLKEMILARRIEDVLSKREILELYLNEIPLGRRSFGVQAASRAYFDKDVGDLDLHEMAFLAILPKAPERYGRPQHEQLALARRNFVIDQMVANEFITPEQGASARREDLGLVQQRQERSADAGYFLEEVRRQLIDKFGETAEDSGNSVYAGGLWVRTSLDMELQDAARDALRTQLLSYQGNRGWSGPVATLNPDNGDLIGQLRSSNLGINYEDWRIGVVTQAGGSSPTIGLTNGETYPLTGAPDALKVGDVVAVQPAGDGYRLRAVPEVSGAFLAQNPQTGRILAMQGGFDARLQAFNRATQAERQPGSTIKPIVYSAALDHGMTPASIIVDGPFCVDQGAGLGTKCFRNFGNSAGAGPHTMRWGIEQSRNLMTVRTASTVGMKNVVAMIKQMGIGDFPPYLAYALGAGETTVSQMVNAYAILANNGRGGDPSLIDFVQDRHGKVIWPENWRACDRCNMADYDGKPMPRPVTHQRQVLDAMTAYQMVHITEGVIQRGTATGLRDLDRPMFGKTGTNNGPTDVWFVGGTPQFVGGLYIGYDHPRSLGGYAQGGTIAVPIFHQFAVKAYEGLEKLPFRAAPGIRMVRIDRASGRPVYGTFPTGNDPKPAVIWEAFKPESEPRRRARRAAEATTQSAPAPTGPATPAPPRDSDFLQREGGIY